MWGTMARCVLNASVVAPLTRRSEKLGPGASEHSKAQVLLRTPRMLAQRGRR